MHTVLTVVIKCAAGSDWELNLTMIYVNDVNSSVDKNIDSDNISVDIFIDVTINIINTYHCRIMCKKRRRKKRKAVSFQTKFRCVVLSQRKPATTAWRPADPTVHIRVYEYPPCSSSTTMEDQGCHSLEHTANCIVLKCSITDFPIPSCSLYNTGILKLVGVFSCFNRDDVTVTFCGGLDKYYQI